MDDMDFDLSGSDSECERNEGFWSESDGELSDNVVAGGEVQAAGNKIRPQQFEPEAGQAEENGDEIPGVHYDWEDIEGRPCNNNWLD